MKEIKDRKLGVITIAPIIEKEVQRAAIAFIDNASFCTNGENIEEKMQEIMKVHTRLYEAIGSKVEQSKSHCYTW